MYVNTISQMAILLSGYEDSPGTADNTKGLDIYKIDICAMIRIF